LLKQPDNQEPPKSQLRNYSFFGPNPSYGFIPRQLSGIPECHLFAQPFRIEPEGKEVQPVGAETNSNN